MEFVFVFNKTTGELKINDVEYVHKSRKPLTTARFNKAMEFMGTEISRKDDKATKTLTVVKSKENYTLEKYLELFDIEVHDVCC